MSQCSSLCRLQGECHSGQVFSVLQLVDGSINFGKGDGGDDVVEDGALRDIVEDGSVNGAVVVEDAVKVRSKDCHVFFAIGRELPICHFHGHLSFFVMDSVSFGKETYVFHATCGLERMLWILEHG